MKTKSKMKAITPRVSGKNSSIVIENIEDLRQREGIDDVQLHQEIRLLDVGDDVRLTFLNTARVCETLLVRIQRIDGPRFRGKLVQRPLATSLLKLGSFVSFAATHIHSVVPKISTPETARK